MMNHRTCSDTHSQVRRGLRRVRMLVLLVLLTSRCGDKAVNSTPEEPITPATLPGTWKFVSAQSRVFTVLSGQSTVTDNGRPTDADVGERTTISGSFTLTNTRYSLSGTIHMTEPGQVPFNKSVTAAGTYSVAGSNVTVIDDASGKQRTFTVSQNGSRLTLIGSYEDWGITAIFEKQ